MRTTPRRARAMGAWLLGPFLVFSRPCTHVSLKYASQNLPARGASRQLAANTGHPPHWEMGSTPTFSEARWAQDFHRESITEMTPHLSESGQERKPTRSPEQGQVSIQNALERGISIMRDLPVRSTENSKEHGSSRTQEQPLPPGLRQRIRGESPHTRPG